MSWIPSQKPTMPTASMKRQSPLKSGPWKRPGEMTPITGGNWKNFRNNPEAPPEPSAKGTSSDHDLAPGLDHRLNHILHAHVAETHELDKTGLFEFQVFKVLGIVILIRSQSMFRFDTLVKSQFLDGKEKNSSP